MKIKNCEQCGLSKDWNGSDIECPYQDKYRFDKENWNCGIIGGIRDLCELAVNGERYGINYQFCDDMKYCTIKTDEIKNMGLCLWVSWYKNRGCTDAIWILDHEEVPRKPTFEDLKEILEFYNVYSI